MSKLILEGDKEVLEVILRKQSIYMKKKNVSFSFASEAKPKAEPKAKELKIKEVKTKEKKTAKSPE